MSLTCRPYRALLPGYIQRELSPQQRARVARHLDECAECYAAYMDQRQLVRDLSVSIPRIGTQRDELPPFEMIRAAVLARTVSPVQPATVGRDLQVTYGRYSLAVLLMVVVLLLPLSMHSQTFNVPTQPTPEKTIAQGTAVAVLPAESTTLTATLQPNYAPILGATDTP